MVPNPQLRSELTRAIQQGIGSINDKHGELSEEEWLANLYDVLAIELDGAEMRLQELRRE
jgi:hypothetical protein